MRSKIRVLLRIDADTHTGMGHAVRMSLLLSSMKSSYELFIVGKGIGLSRFFPRASIYPSNGHQELRFARLIRRCNANMLMIDHPHSGALDWAFIHKDLGVPSVVVDDWGGKHRADLIINGTVLPEFHRYPNAPKTSQILAGPRFALVHRAFSNLKWKKKSSFSKRITIVIGSGDRASRWAFRLLSGKIDFKQWGKVTMVVGHTFSKFSALKARASLSKVRIFKGVPSVRLSELLATSDAVLCTGGGIVYESLALNVPTVVFPQIDNMISEATWFAKHGCIVNLGYDGGMSMTKIEKTVSGILNDSARAMAMSEAAKGIIDGKGVQRAADALDRLIHERVYADK